MAKRLVMLTGSLGLMLFVTEQYIQPTIDNSLKPLRDMVGRGWETGGRAAVRGTAAWIGRARRSHAASPMQPALVGAHLLCIACWLAMMWGRMPEALAFTTTTLPLHPLLLPDAPPRTGCACWSAC